MGLAQTVLSMRLTWGRKHETRVLGRPPEELELKLNLEAGRASREGEHTQAKTQRQKLSLEGKHCYLQKDWQGGERLVQILQIQMEAA